MSIESAEKGGYDYFMAKEIYEQDIEEIAPIFKKMDWSLAKIGDSAYLKRLNQVVELKTLIDNVIASKNNFSNHVMSYKEIDKHYKVKEIAVISEINI